MRVIFLIVGVFFALSVLSGSAFAQTDTSKQITLSKDLQNDPQAQDILKKIEQTKKQIAEIEQQKSEKIQAQKFLQERRNAALAKLNQDLDTWNAKWEQYSPKNSFDRFVNKKPENVRGVYQDAFEFKEKKVNAGRSAYGEVVTNNGPAYKAREAYNDAAKTKKIEVIEQNSKSNLNYGLALHDQEILFNSQGRFIGTEEARNILHSKYDDYKMNPLYLLMNPQDKIAHDYYIENQNKNTTKPVVEKNDTKVQEQIDQANAQFSALSKDYQIKKLTITDSYDKRLADLESEAKSSEDLQISNHTQSNKDLSKKITKIRENLKDDKEKLMQQRADALDEAEREFEMKSSKIINDLNSSILIKILWNDQTLSYQAMLK